MSFPLARQQLGLAFHTGLVHPVFKTEDEVLFWPWCWQLWFHQFSSHQCAAHKVPAIENNNHVLFCLNNSMV